MVDRGEIGLADAVAHAGVDARGRRRRRTAAPPCRAPSRGRRSPARMSARRRGCCLPPAAATWRLKSLSSRNSRKRFFTSHVMPTSVATSPGAIAGCAAAGPPASPQTNSAPIAANACNMRRKVTWGIELLLELLWDCPAPMINSSCDGIVTAECAARSRRQHDAQGREWRFGGQFTRPAVICRDGCRERIANGEVRIGSCRRPTPIRHSLFATRRALLAHPGGLRRDGPARDVLGDGAGKLLGAAAERVESLRPQAGQDLVRFERFVDGARRACR